MIEEDFFARQKNFPVSWTYFNITNEQHGGSERIDINDFYCFPLQAINDCLKNIAIWIYSPDDNNFLHIVHHISLD